MSYNITGLSHHNGLKNELDCYNWLIENLEHISFLSDVKKENIIKLGGTKNKNDIEILKDDGTKINLSLKNLDINGSSHDWANIFLDKSFDKFKALNEIKDEMTSIRNLPLEERFKLKKSFKSLRIQKTQELFELISNDTEFLENFIFNRFSPIENQKIIVNNRKEKCYQIYDGKEHILFKYLKNSNYSLSLINISQKSKESRRLFALKKSDGQTFDLGLRLRILTNNGDSAAIGLNEGTNKNQTSCLVLKIQQDNVRSQIKLLKELNVLQEYKY